VDYDPTHHCQDTHGQQEFCAPQAFPGTITRLWRNVTKIPGATPRFEDLTETSGLTKTPGVALGIVCADFDGDGWIDIFCADDGRPNRLFINQHNGRFVDEATARGLGFNTMGATAANMGIAYGDFDGDGLGDVFVTHLTEEFHSLWRQGPRGLFADQIAQVGLQEPAWRGTGFGTAFADFDQDGAPDLVLANGLIRRMSPGQTPTIPGLDPWWARYAQKAQLFSNDGHGRFRDISAANAALSGQARVGRSLVVGDLDNDGALDLVICSTAGPTRLLRNVVPNRGHWLRVRLLDPAHGNRDAIGAEVTIVGGGRRWWSICQPASSYLSSHDPAVHFGLGSAGSFERLEILWPDGNREHFAGGPTDRLLIIRRGTGKRPE
jgi:hypothetical protein